MTLGSQDSHATGGTLTMPRRHIRPIAIVVTSLSLACVAAWPTAARAENASSQAAAQALFEEARTLMNQGKFAEACPKFAESQRLDPGAGTLLNLANCYEKNGQTASAWVTFKDAAAAADVKKRVDWSQRARERAAAIEPLLSRLTIAVSAEAKVDGLEVRRDGVTVGSAEWGTAIPVDPGEHAIEATAPKRKKWSTVAKVGPKADKASVTVPALESEPVASAVVDPSLPPKPVAADTPPPSEPAPGSTGSGQRTVGLVVGGFGVAGLAVGTVFGLTAISKGSDAKKLCPTAPSCSSAEGVQANDDAKSAAAVSTVGMIVGGVALAAGAVLYLTAPKGASKETATRVHVAPNVGYQSVGLNVGGAW
jgi:hypothetical protein